MKQIPFADFPKGREMDSPPPNGTYAVISHNPGERRITGALAPTAFPWRTTIYEFKDGVGDERAAGTDAGDMLGRHEVAKVFLIGLDSVERATLDENLGS
jgi:hypothetical protein